MKKKGLWTITPVILLLGVALLLVTGATLFLYRPVFYGACTVTAAVFAFGLWRLRRLNADMRRYMVRVAGSLSQSDQDALASFPMPAALCSQEGDVLWYNELFRDQVLDGRELVGETVGQITGGVSMEDIACKRFMDVALNKHRYTVYISPIPVRSETLYALYYVDDTRLKEIADEYRLSRPAAMLVYIDNLDEIAQNTRDSERAQLSGRVETLLEDWTGTTTGVLRKYSSDRFLMMVEQRHLQSMVDSRFEILDQVRSVQTAGGMSITLSIGVAGTVAPLKN
ncbi:MAG: hypothetical protein HFJ80_01065, partial [Clostridiales bacterium]|nr:hypothetical protein [Clostridiales bacterium]